MRARTGPKKKGLSLWQTIFVHRYCHRSWSLRINYMIQLFDLLISEMLCRVGSSASRKGLSSTLWISSPTKIMWHLFLIWWLLTITVHYFVNIYWISTECQIIFLVQVLCHCTKQIKFLPSWVSRSGGIRNKHIYHVRWIVIWWLVTETDILAKSDCFTKGDVTETVTMSH